jgi:hypothetical protein
MKEGMVSSEAKISFAFRFPTKSKKNIILLKKEKEIW